MRRRLKLDGRRNRKCSSYLPNGKLFVYENTTTIKLTIRLIRTSLHLLLLHELHGQTSMEFWQACAASNFLICYKHNSLPAEPFSVIHLCLLTVLKVLLGSTATRDCSVTRLGDLLNFGQLFKACGNNQFAQIYHILRQFF